MKQYSAPNIRNVVIAGHGGRGKTTLAEAVALLEEEPLAQLPISETTAELYRVCPGTAAVYHYTDLEDRNVSFTLYADENGIVRFIKLAFEP